MKVRTEYVKLLRHMKPSEVNLEDRCNHFGGLSGTKKRMRRIGQFLFSLFDRSF